MSSYLFRAFFYKHVRGSIPQLVIRPPHTLVNPKDYVGWSPANQALTIGTQPALLLCDLRTGKLLHQWQGGSPMAWSPDGSMLLTHCLPDVRGAWTFQIRDAQTGEVRCTYDGECGSHVYALAWSPDGTRIAHCTFQRRDRVYIWDAQTGKSLVEYCGHEKSSYVDKLVWSPDSTLLVSTSCPVPIGGTTQLWQSADGKLLSQIPSHEIWGSSLSGKTFVQIVKHALTSLKAAAPKPVGNFWETFTQQCLTDPRYLALLLYGMWSPDGEHVALIDRDRIVLLNWRTGKQERCYGGHMRDKPYLVPPKTQYGPRSLSWSPDGQRIASIDVRGLVHIWPTSVPFPWLPWPKAPIQVWK